MLKILFLQNSLQATLVMRRPRGQQLRCAYTISYYVLILLDMRKGHVHGTGSSLTSPTPVGSLGQNRHVRIMSVIQTPGLKPVLQWVKLVSEICRVSVSPICFRHLLVEHDMHLPQGCASYERVYACCGQHECVVHKTPSHCFSVLAPQSRP